MQANKRGSWLFLTLISFLNGCHQTQVVSQETYTPSNKMVENNMLRGIEYMKLGKYDIALERFNEALTVDPNYAEAHDAIAILYEQLGQSQQAQLHYEQAITLKSHDSNIHNNYGQFLCKQGQWEAAHTHFLKAAENPLYRTPHIPYTNAAICAFLYKHDLTQADIYLRKALQTQQKFETALYWMSKISYEQGFHVQAQDYLTRYLETGEHTAEVLWLGFRIAHSLNESDMAENYAQQLRSQYPDSEQTRLLNLDKP